jgi:cytosine/adenosine deaminase-related metal-dependent hydrolase
VYLEVFGLDDAKIPETMAGLEAGIERTRESAAPELSVGLGSDAGPRDDGRLDGGSSPMTHGPAVDVGVSPHAPYSVSARLYREVARFARREGLKLATHVAESREELDLLTRGKSPIPGAYRAANLWTGQRWKPPMQRPIQYVAGTCALGPDTLAVHAVQVNGDDITALTASGAAVAHCPRSNRHLNCGIAPVAEMIAAGVTVGLGTDSLASNDSLDMFAEMRAALTASRARAETSPGALSAPLTAEAVVRMATLEGARALGWDHLVGSLEPGKRADLIVARLSDRTPVGRQRDPDGLDVAEAVVSTITADDVRLTMVEGLEIAGDDFSLPPRDVASGLQAAQSKLGWRKSRD